MLERGALLTVKTYHVEGFSLLLYPLFFFFFFFLFVRGLCEERRLLLLRRFFTSKC